MMTWRFLADLFASVVDCFQYHPDVCKGSNCGVQFHKINEAYDVNYLKLIPYSKMLLFEPFSSGFLCLSQIKISLFIKVSIVLLILNALTLYDVIPDCDEQLEGRVHYNRPLWYLQWCPRRWANERNAWSRLGIVGGVDGMGRCRNPRLLIPY